MASLSIHEIDESNLLRHTAQLKHFFGQRRGPKGDFFLTVCPFVTSNGYCRREEKSRKHWSLFTMLLSLVNIFFFVKSNQKQLYILIALKIREK